MTQGLVGLLAFTTIFSQKPKLIAPIADYGQFEQREVKARKEEILASHVLNLNNRDENESINEVYKYNILLAISRIPFQDLPQLADQNELREQASFILQPDEVFAFHENILPKFSNKIIKTMGSRFLAKEGYRSSGWIVGDGVCHLASLMNWTASKAGLETMARVRHDFRSIPGVPKEYWISIRYSQLGHNSQNQNLYIENNFDFPIEFEFKVKDEKMELKIISLR